MCYISTPKPEHLIIKKSPWYGTTVFTNKDISEGKVIAMTIHENYNKNEGYFNTPFGIGFNSTDNLKEVNAVAVVEKLCVRIISIRDIKAGEEILLKY